MLSRVTILCMAFCLCAVVLVNSKEIKSLSAYKNDLESHFASDSLPHFSDFYHKVQNLVENGKESAERLVSKDLVCKYLKKVNYQRAANAGLGSQFIYLYVAFGCPVQDLTTDFNAILKSAQKGEKVDDIISALHLAQHNKEYHGTEIKEACSKVFDLLKDDGTARAYKRSGEYNLTNTAKVLDAINRCQNVGVLAANVTKNKLRGTFSSIVEHGKAMGHGIKAFAEGNFFDTTSRITHLIHRLSPETIKSQDLAPFLSYLKGHREALDAPERHHWFHRAAGTFKEVPVVDLQTKSLTKGKELVLRAKINNLLGEEISDSNLKLKGSLYGVDEKDQTVAIASGINFERKGNVFEAKLKDKDVPKPDHYQLRLTVSSGSSSYEYVENLVVRGELSISSVQFGVTKSPDRANAPLEHQVKVGETYRGTLEANQGNYIHVEIKVASGSPKPGFIGARLVNKNSNRPTTGTVPAKLDRDSNEYRTIIDLGDSEHILPYNGKYELEVIISGDYIGETARWTLANLDITFVKPSDKPPASDADVQLLPEIHHQFPGARRKPAFVITAFFSAASIVAFVGFLVILFKIGVNFNNLPSNATGRISSIIFLGLILALLGTLTLFWLKINIFETLLLLTILSIPTIIVGSKALQNINLQESKSE
jgi:hypothetical protein